MFRVGNGCDIQKELSQDTVCWKRIAIPSASSCINSLVAVCLSGKETGFAYDGQVYVLSGSVISNESFIHRFFIRDVQKNGVNDNTVCLVPDYGVRDHVSSFIAFGSYRNNYATDGLVHLSTRGGNAPLLHALPAFIGGKFVASPKGQTISFPWTSNSCVRPIVKNSADGSWLVAGDFGICTYQ